MMSELSDWTSIKDAIRERLKLEGFDGVEATIRAANAMRAARAVKANLSADKPQ